MVAISDADFFARLRGVIARGWVPIPNYPGYRGSGGPGRILEECIGVEPNNRDGPDTGIWELKYHGGSGPLLLCFIKRRFQGATCTPWSGLLAGQIEKAV